MSRADRTDVGSVAQSPSGNSFAGDVWANAKRWHRKAIRNPSTAVLELALGVISLVMFTSVFGEVGSLALAEVGLERTTYVTFLLPAVLIQVAMSSSISSGIGLVTDLQTGMFEKTVVTPMRWTALFAGKAAAELSRLVAHVLVLVALALAMGATVATGPVGILLLLVVCLLFATWYMALSNVLALLSRDEETLDAAANILLFPLLFLSPAFLPLDVMPDWIRVVAAVNPVTYGVAAARTAVLGRDVLTVVEVSLFGGIYDTLVPAIGILLVLNVIVGGLAVWTLDRATGAAVQ